MPLIVTDDAPATPPPKPTAVVEMKADAAVMRDGLNDHTPPPSDAVAEVWRKVDAETFTAPAVEMMAPPRLADVFRKVHPVEETPRTPERAPPPCARGVGAGCSRQSQGRVGGPSPQSRQEVSQGARASAATVVVKKQSVAVTVLGLAAAPPKAGEEARVKLLPARTTDALPKTAPPAAPRAQSEKVDPVT